MSQSRPLADATRDATPTGSGTTAVVLLSGGLDSATVLSMARASGMTCHTLAFDYGQRHRHELVAAARVAAAMGAATHRTMRIDLRDIGGSALTAAIDVPKHRSASAMAADIPVTYVPSRNIIFLSMASALAEVLEARAIFLGVNAIDYSGYPDCRPEFIEAFQRVLDVGTKAGAEGRPVRIHAPILRMTKAQIIREGTRLGVDYALTHSCYDPVDLGGGDIRACGACDSCQLRREGFAAAGVPDPTRYAPTR
ncbi:MAG: 7-cyano-7-deazaguanine synthase QueC [Phycisphaerae bacterium]|jgi:7-cyano-7-deazaguanine synthase